MAEPVSPSGAPQTPAGPEMIASTTEPFFMSSGETRVRLRLHRPGGPALGREPGSLVVFLRVENVTGDNVAPTFSAYVNLPEGADPNKHSELFAGSMGMFGLPEASLREGEHGGSGKNFTLDITRLFHALAQRNAWNPQELTVSFVPSPWDWPVPRLRVGRLSLYLQ